MTRLKKWLTGLLILLILSLDWLVTAPPAVYACSCAPPPPPQEALAAATAVFAGQVTAVEAKEGPIISSADPVRVTFYVAQVWKGDLPQNVVVTTPREDASCGFNFIVGHEYIVYAQDNGHGLSTNLCSRTAELSPDLEDLNALGPGTAPPQEAGGALAVGINPSAFLAFALILLAAAAIVTAVVLFRRRGRARKRP